MTTLDTLLAGPLVHRLGWMLVHSFWQLTLAALVLSGVLLLLRRRSANARYVAGCGGLLLALVLPAVTLWMIQPVNSGSPIPAVSAMFSLAAAPTGRAAAPASHLSPAVHAPDAAERTSSPAGPLDELWRVRALRILEANLPWIVLAWLVGAGVLSLRIVGCWLKAQTLRRVHVALPPVGWHDRFAALAQRLGVTRPVHLLQSHLARVPTVVGHLRPVVLLPVAALTGLAPQQVEAILAHELAHIRRHDYLVNLLQVLVETVLFYHPAIWWISRRIRIERENCCDDLAIQLCRDRFGYIRALVSLEELRDAPAPKLAVAWQGTSLLDRARRLLGVPAPQTLQSGRWMAGPVVLLTGLVLAAILLFVSPSKAEPQAEKAKDKDVAAAPEAGIDPGSSKPIARWERYTVTETRTDKQGKEVQELSFLVPKQYEAKIPETAAQEVKLQIYFVKAFAGTDLSAAAKILGKPSGKVVAGKDAILRPDEHMVISDDQLRELLTAAKKWGIGGVDGYREPLVVRDHGVAVMSEDRRGLEVALSEQNGQAKSQFEVLSANRFAARAQIASGRTVKLDCMLHVMETGDGDSARPVLTRIRSQAAAEVPVHSSLVMPVSMDQVKPTAYRKRSDTDKPAIDLFMESIPQAQSFMTAFAIVRPVVVKAQGASSQAMEDATASAGDEFEFDMTPERLPAGELNAKVAQIDIAKAKLEDVVRVFGEPDSYICIWGNERTRVTSERTSERNTFTKGNLPAQYCMMYPDGFQVFMSGGLIQELRFEHDSSFVWRGGLHIGSTLEDVLNVVGQPTETVVGEPIGWQDGVLYKDIDGRNGYGYYARGDQGIRMFFMNNKLGALYITRDQPTSETTMFRANLQARVSQVNINQAKREDLIQVFGSPTRYVWANEGQLQTFQENELPNYYIMEYPSGFSAFMANGYVRELRFESRDSGPAPDYAYQGKLRVGSTLDEALDVIGQPDKVVEGGKIGFEDGVLYKNADGWGGNLKVKGFGYYQRAKQGVRVFFLSDRVRALYLPRTEPNPGDQK